MNDNERSSHQLTIEEAYILYKVRCHPELWDTLNRYIKPDGTIRSEAEAAAFNGDGVFKIKK